MERGKRIAVVTGASSGLGRCFVRRIQDMEDVEEIWVIARRGNRLRELEKQKTELENLEIIGAVRGMDISLDELAAMLRKGQPPQSKAEKEEQSQ